MQKTGAVYVQTNDASANEVVAFARAADGTLERIGAYATGGRGSGEPHLPSQGSVTLTGDGRWLLVANAGSDDVSTFALGGSAPSLASRVSAGGTAPRSIAEHGARVYVLNTGEPSIAAFAIEDDGTLSPLAPPVPLRPQSDPAQVGVSPDGRTLVVTERGADTITAFGIGEDGALGDAVTIASSGPTPYGFDFAPDGSLVVTEAFRAEIGRGAASSYALGSPARLELVTGSAANGQSEICWAAVTPDGRFAYVTNFGDGTISSYSIGRDGSITLVDANAAATHPGRKGVRDEALSADGRFLYALDADAQQVFGWRVGADGSLTPLGAVDGLAPTAAGLAAA